MAIGALELTPSFNPKITAYTAETFNATNKITATAADENASVTIESDEATIAADGTATWENGENTVTITVTNGENKKIYTVVVTQISQEPPLLNDVSFTRDASQTLELTPEFAPNTESYRATTEYTDWELAVEAADEDTTIRVELNGRTIPTADVMPLSLTSGTNFVSITVEREYYMPNVYSVAITVE